MNLSAVIYFLSGQLQTFVRTYTRNNELLDCFIRRIDLHDTLYDLPGIESFVLDSTFADVPQLSSINQKILYGTVTTENHRYVLGPVFITEDIMMKHNLNDIKCESAFMQQLPSCSVTFFVNHILLLHNLFQSEPVLLQTCLKKNTMADELDYTIRTRASELLFYNREYKKRHNPYDQEHREMSSIEAGDLEQLKKSWEEEYVGSLGKIAKDPNRSGRNLAIIVVALATRAAIRGGVLPEAALSLGDTYMMQIEETKNPYEIEPLTKNAEYALTQLVSESKSQQQQEKSTDDNILIERCKDYVFSHLHGKITVQEIADYLYLHPGYLSALFKKHEGLPLYQYILNEKISLTKNLLTYSSYSFSEISSYLGFSSQSHLGKAFKNVVGMTLKQYRNRYSKTNAY